MSTHLRRSPTDAAPVSPLDLVGYFEAGAKPPANWRVGAEFEKIAVDRASGRQIGFDAGIESFLRRLVEKFGWEGHEELGRLTTLTRGSATISVEPGGQLELSTPPARHIAELEGELRQHLQELASASDQESVAWIAAGVTPFSRVDDIAINPRPRHRFMARYLPTRCKYGLHMMKATASTQVTFDYADESDAGRKFAAAMLLSPIVNAAFANAPLYAGRATGFTSFRAEIWRGMDPDRSGFLTDLLAGGVSFESWIDFALDVPLLFVDFGGELRPAPGRSFRDWMDHAIDGRWPTLDDWDIHLSTIFTEARLKRYLEVRGADATPLPLALSAPAVWKGLFYDRDALAAAIDLAGAVSPNEIDELAQIVARQGLRGVYRGRRVSEWCGEVAAIAAGGLSRQARDHGGADETAYLDPMREVIEGGRSPGDRWANASSVTEVLAQCEYRRPLEGTGSAVR